MSDHSDAEILQDIDNRIWRRLRIKSGGQLQMNPAAWERFKLAVAAQAPYFVRKGVVELLQASNHHSFLRALRELGRLD